MNQRRIRYSGRAEADLDEIGIYTATHHGKAQARKYLRSIQTTVRKLAPFPEAGSPQSQIGRQIRKINSGSHVIYYRVEEGYITVIRILHQRMDVTGRF